MLLKAVVDMFSVLSGLGASLGTLGLLGPFWGLLDRFLSDTG